MADIINNEYERRRKIVKSRSFVNLFTLNTLTPALLTGSPKDVGV